MARIHAPIIFAGIVTLAGTFATFSACGDQCSKESDCASKEVCSSGSCVAATSAYVSCAGNGDCGAGGQFECRAGRCELKGGVIIVPADSGVVDLGVPDLGVADMGVRADGGPADSGRDSGVEDTGISLPDTGTSTSVDAGGSATAPDVG